jgi:hypothetical protein
VVGKRWHVVFCARNRDREQVWRSAGMGAEDHQGSQGRSLFFISMIRGRMASMAYSHISSRISAGNYGLLGWGEVRRISID